MRIASILGQHGDLGRGVYRVTVGLPDVRLTDHGVPVSSFLGFNTWAAFQGTPERAAVAGDFAMLEDEVAPVIDALVRSGIEVGAVHNHIVTEEPRIFFLHYWGVGPADQLARGCAPRWTTPAPARTGTGTGTAGDGSGNRRTGAGRQAVRQPGRPAATRPW